MSVISVKYIWVQNKSNQHWDLREKGYTFEHLTWNIWTLNLKHHHNLDFLFMGILGRFFLKLTLKILLKAKVVLILYAGSKEFVFRLEECKFCVGSIYPK